MILLRLWALNLKGGGGFAFSLIPSFNYLQITLDNLAWSAIGRDLTS